MQNKFTKKCKKQEVNGTGGDVMLETNAANNKKSMPMERRSSLARPNK
jgi:hypothetical protein